MTQHTIATTKAPEATASIFDIPIHTSLEDDFSGTIEQGFDEILEFAEILTENSFISVNNRKKGHHASFETPTRLANGKRGRWNFIL
jgi:hypothetical protein